MTDVGREGLMSLLWCIVGRSLEGEYSCGPTTRSYVYRVYILFTGQWGNGEWGKQAIIIAIILKTEEHSYVFNYYIDPGSVNLKWKIDPPEFLRPCKQDLY